MMHSAITAVTYYLPETVLSNSMLSAAFPEWSMERIEEKTGICERHIAGVDECASDLACHAAKKLFDKYGCLPKDIDYILFCTQSPDYLLPTTACLLQERLGIPTHAGALDFNLGCSGFVYGLSLAKGLIASAQARNILLLTAETYTKYIKEDDKVNRTIFGDGAAATIVSAVDQKHPSIGPFVLGTNGKGAKNLMVHNSGARTEGKRAHTTRPELFMDGPEIFTFTLTTIPRVIKELFEKTGFSDQDIDFYIFHQANHYILEHLRKRLQISTEKMYIFLEKCGNTVSSTIPIALSHGLDSGTFKQGMKLMLVGFGVGYSWGATIITL